MKDEHDDTRHPYTRALWLINTLWTLLDEARRENAILRLTLEEKAERTLALVERMASTPERRRAVPVFAASGTRRNLGASILTALRESPKTPSEIAAAIGGCQLSNMSVALRRLREAGLVVKDGRTYSPTAAGAASIDTATTITEETVQ